MTPPTDWVSVLSVTQEMLDAARTADWPTLEKLEQQRHALIRNYFATLRMEHEPDKIASQIKTLREFDEQIMEYCTAGRDAVSSELHDLHRGKKAGQAYLSHSR